MSTMNQINFDYNDKHYCLEYTPESIKQMEAAGFSINDFSDKPQTRIEQLWAGAFLAHNRKTSNNVMKELYGKMKDKDKLLEALRNMVAETYNSLMDEGDEGNVEWTATI